MTGQVSDRLREALERLDQTIDRLDHYVNAHLGGAAGYSGGDAGPDNAIIAERLDRMIGQIELALSK